MKVNRQEVFDKLGGHCAYCGIEIKINKFQIDHVYPKAGGGSDEISNLMPACCSCNNYKSTMLLDRFREMLGEQISILRRDRPTFRLAERFGLVSCHYKPVTFYFERFYKTVMI